MYPSINHIFNETTGKKETLESLLNGPDRARWLKALSNEIGRLASGNIYGVKFTNTIKFIKKSDVPSDKTVTYATFVCDFRPLKSEPWRIRCVVGGDKLPYDSDPSSPAANLLETKILLNSTISDSKHGAKFLTADIKDHFLASPMEKPEYMRMPLKIMPQDIIDRYNLQDIVADDGYVYIQIVKGMYGLKQAALLAYNELCSFLKPAGYSPIPSSLSMWKHHTRKTIFSLCVDDFGVNYFNKKDADHLLQTLRRRYQITVDWNGRHYCGLTIDWNYRDGHVDISIPKYISTWLSLLKHPKPKKMQHTPHPWTLPAYGRPGVRQTAKTEPDLPLLNPTQTKYVQSVAGKDLYYSRAVDPTCLPALTEIQIRQAKPTTLTLAKSIIF